MDRYFIGLMVPQHIGEQLYAFARSIQDSVPSDQTFRTAWTAPIDLHCTLLFIGQSPDEQLLIEQMERVAAQLPPVTLSVAGQTHWLGRNSLALAATGAESVGATVIEQLRDLSSDKWAGRRPFYGHVSLGRVRPVPSPENDYFSGHTVEPASWTARHVQLVKSFNGDPAQRYRVVAEAPFGS